MMPTARLAMLVLVVPATLMLSVCSVGRVEAQEDKWSFVVTPQLWLANIPKNGFAAPASQLFNANTGANLTEFLTPGSTSPDSVFYPQWGGQFAAQYGRWTLGVTAQYVSFETSTPLNLNQPIPAAPAGTKVNTEIINTDRTDVDFTLSYFFPDVIRDVLDLSAGGGVKWIRASGHRSLQDTSFNPSLDYIARPFGASSFGPDSPSDSFGHVTNRASFLVNYYGATIPTTFTFRLTSSGKWLLPVTASPFLGWEGNNDQVNGWKTAFAYGGTFDAGVRYVFDSGIAVYMGYRAQVIQGVDLFFAQGPLFNMSVRFGGK